MSLNHQEFKVSESGFFISQIHSHIGASPDGLVQCLCCGEGVYEIKAIELLQYNNFVVFFLFFLVPLLPS